MDREKFQGKISQLLEERETDILLKKNLTVDIDPKIAQLLESSNMVSGKNKVIRFLYSFSREKPSPSPKEPIEKEERG